MAYNVGDTITLDGIESLIIYKADIEQEWGQYIVVDKNHDLIWYIEGTDCMDEDINDPDGTDCINYNYKYGYEWGGFHTSTGINDQPIGDGLTNTNSLVELNLQPYKEGWYVLWDKVKEFRQSYSDKWFVPSLQELHAIYDNKGSLANLSTSTESCYWSSSQCNRDVAYTVRFRNGSQYDAYKYEHYHRSRLCRYTTDSELNSWALNETLSKDKLNRMETNLQSINSSYQTTNWQDNDIVTADKLNKLEQGLKEVKSDYTDHTWVDGEEITATKLNNISLNI